MRGLRSVSWALILILSLQLLFLIQLSVGQTCNSSCISDQQLALNNLYAALNGSAWVSDTRWNSAPTGGPEYCLWEGVYCCKGETDVCLTLPADSAYITACTTPCAVVGLSLANNNLVGQIEDNAGTIWEVLDTLEFVNLQGNSLTGSIPASLASLPLLVGISVEANMLTGTIPSELFASSIMTEVVLAQNKLTGSIPDMSNMTDLVLLDLSENLLQGSLPTAWASSSYLGYFSVQTNQLTGSIPVSNLADRYLATDLPSAKAKSTVNNPAAICTYKPDVLDVQPGERQSQTHFNRCEPCPSVQKGQESSSLMVMDMGQHVVQDYAQPLTLHQVMVPGLEDRARAFPRLSTARQLSPGYFDAPATKQAPLGGARGQGLKAELPLVTLVFSAVDGLKAMRARGDVAAEHAMTLYKDVIRRLLRTTEGYECQEAEGNFMLVFHRPMKAVQFCLLVQEELLKVHWREDVLSLPQCQAQVGVNQGLIFVGPRIKMGIYEGIPTRVAPHTTTGSADYFGPLVNRAARFCNGAAHGGQVVGPTFIVPGLLRSWGCERAPDSMGSAMFIQVPAVHAQLHYKDDFRFPSSFGGPVEASQAPASVGTNSSPRGSGQLPAPQAQGIHPSAPAEPDQAFSFGSSPQTPQAAIPSGIFPSPETSPVPSPKRTTEIALSAISRIANPVYGVAADPQKLAASWVSHQHYGESAEQGQSAGATAPAWQIAAPAPSPRGPLYMHRRSSTMMKHHKKPSGRSMSAKPSFASGLISELGVSGSANSMTALLKVEEADEVNEAEADAGAAMLLLSLRLAPVRSALTEAPQVPQPELSGELSADAVERMRTSQTDCIIHSMQYAERSSAVSVASVATASSVQGRDPLLEALSEVHISHIGEMRFKGVADPQSVMQFNTAHLAARQFPQEPPSAKAELAEVGRGLQYVVMMKEPPAVPPSRPLSVIV